MGADVDTRTSPPPRKRLRTEVASNAQTNRQEPRLFAPFRALGLITNSVPFVLQTRSHKGATDGPRIHLVTCLGKAWAMWEGGKMGLLFVGKCEPSLAFQARPHMLLYRPRCSHAHCIFGYGRECGLGFLRPICHKILARKRG